MKSMIKKMGLNKKPVMALVDVDQEVGIAHYWGFVTPNSKEIYKTLGLGLIY